MVRLVDSDRATPRSPPEPAGIDCGAALVARRVSSTTEKRGPCNGVGWAFKVRSSPGCAFCSGMRPSSAAGWKSPSRRAPAAGDSGLVVAGANSANKQLDDLQLQVGELRAENLKLQQRSSAAAREAQSVKMAAELDVQLLQGKAGRVRWSRLLRVLRVGGGSGGLLHPPQKIPDFEMKESFFEF